MNILEFQSKACKDETHQRCAGRWQGYGFQVNCRCSCHETVPNECKSNDSIIGKGI
jgi:hypothetical protein